MDFFQISTTELILFLAALAKSHFQNILWFFVYFFLRQSENNVS